MEEKRLSTKERDDKLDALGKQFDNHEISWQEYRKASIVIVARWPKSSKGE